MIPSRLVLFSSGWHPRKMFAPADLGTIQTPTNLAAIYQESTGITAGAVGSLVGRFLDERYSLARLWEGWVDASTTFTGESSKVSTGVYRVFSSAGALSSVNCPGALVVGTVYEALFTVDSIAAAGTGIQLDGSGVTITTTGAKRMIFTATATTAIIKRLSAALACDYQISAVSIRELPGGHAAQATAGSRPTLDAGGKINYSAGAKSLVTTWPSSLGSSCTVARAVPGVGAEILTGQTIGTTYTDNTDHCGLVIINRDLTATETNKLRRWLNRRAG
jgi:hypothetical protein